MLITVFDGLPSKVASETATVQKYTVMQKKKKIHQILVSITKTHT